MTKGSNKLAYLLQENLNEPLNKFEDIIIDNIKKINLFLPNQDLSELFDSINALKEIDSLSYEFIPIIGNLNNTLVELDNNISETVNNITIKLNDDIYDYLNNSHNLIFQIFNNLNELTDENC